MSTPPNAGSAKPPVANNNVPAANNAGASGSAAAAADATFCICQALFGASADKLWGPLLAATLVQFFWSFIWYSLIAHNAYVRSVAVDKGVKAAAFIKQRYSMAAACFNSLITGLFRAAAIFSVIHHVGPKVLASQCQLCIYAQAGLAVWLVQVLPAIEESLYAQRPLSLILVHAGNSLGCVLLAATTLAFM